MNDNKYKKMPDSAEYAKVLLHLNIASYATTIPTLILWIFVLVRILIQKARAKFFALIVICVLMIAT
jgi:hypothetical protein